MEVLNNLAETTLSLYSSQVFGTIAREAVHHLALYGSALWFRSLATYIRD